MPGNDGAVTLTVHVPFTANGVAFTQVVPVMLSPPMLSASTSSVTYNGPVPVLVIVTTLVPGAAKVNVENKGVVTRVPLVALVKDRWPVPCATPVTVSVRLNGPADFGENTTLTVHAAAAANAAPQVPPAAPAGRANGCGSPPPKLNVPPVHVPPLLVTVRVIGSSSCAMPGVTGSLPKAS